jgi:leucyl aminopeptidase
MIDAGQILNSSAKNAIPLRVVSKADIANLPARIRTLAQAQGFDANPLALLIIANSDGKTAEVLVGAPLADADPFALGSIASKLPAGHYRFVSESGGMTLVALGWCLELYKYDPFRATAIKKITLQCPKSVDRVAVISAANSSFAVRDMINAPANLFGPDELEAAARKIANGHKAKFKVIKGKALEKDFPLIHIVGAASPRAPRLIDFTWGKASAPKLTLVGKGVCFDTGGLDIKPSSGMLIMKKDMGGAANILGLAQLIMQAKLNVRLRVLIPAVENSIAGNAFRPGDVFKTRNRQHRCRRAAGSLRSLGFGR